MCKSHVQVRTLDQFLNDIEVLSILEDVIHSNDIWVLCFHYNPELIHKQIVAIRLLTEQSFLQYFESLRCLLTICAFNPALVDLTESILTKELTSIIFLAKVLRSFSQCFLQVS